MLENRSIAGVNLSVAPAFFNQKQELV